MQRRLVAMVTVTAAVAGAVVEHDCHPGDDGADVACKNPQIHCGQMLAAKHMPGLSQGAQKETGMVVDIDLGLHRQGHAGPVLQWRNET